MGVSPRAQQFAKFLESVRAKLSTPDLDLGIARLDVELRTGDYLGVANQQI